MYTNSLSMKTIYIIEKLKSSCNAPHTEKIIFSISKTLRSLIQSYSIMSDFKALTHSQISRLLKKSLSLDNLLCSILKILRRKRKFKSLNRVSLSEKLTKPHKECILIKQLKKVEQVVQKYINRTTSNRDTFDYELYPKIELHSKRLTLSMISTSSFGIGKSLNDSSSSSDISTSSSLGSSFQ